MFESNMFEKENNKKESLVMSIGEAAKQLNRNRQFVEACIKHKLLVAWSMSNPKKTKKSNRKANIQIPRANFEQFYRNYCKANFYDNLCRDAKNDLSIYFLPAYMIHCNEKVIDVNITQNISNTEDLSDEALMEKTNQLFESMNTKKLKAKKN